MSRDISDVYTYWNSRPCNIRHSNKSIDSVEFFDEVSEKKYRAEPHKKEFLALEQWKGKRVLELGSGLGTDAIQFARAGADVVCVDLTDFSLELCKKNFELHGLQGTFFQGNIEELDTFLPESYLQSFDLVYSFGVIHHTPHPAKVFQQIARYVKPSGELRCMVYSKFSYKLFWLMKEYDTWSFEHPELLVQQYSEAQEGCPITYTYTFDEIKDLIAPYFSIQSIWKDHIFCWDIESYKKNMFVPAKAFESVDPTYFRQMEKELGWHTMFVAKLT